MAQPAIASRTSLPAGAGRSRFGARLARTLAAVAFVATASGCSALLAVSGKDTPYSLVLFIGSPRERVIEVLGEPDTAAVRPHGYRVDSYVLELGDPPNGTRAFGHVIADLYSLGLWELIGTPLEIGRMFGGKRRFLIFYDGNDAIADIDELRVSDDADSAEASVDDASDATAAEPVAEPDATGALP